jgi:hypothetical protein
MVNRLYFNINERTLNKYLITNLEEFFLYKKLSPLITNKNIVIGNAFDFFKKDNAIWFHSNLEKPSKILFFGFTFCFEVLNKNKEVEIKEVEIKEVYNIWISEDKITFNKYIKNLQQLELF